MSYQHIFFDLDHTLWDFKTNSRNALRGIYKNFNLLEHGVQSELEFIATYERINEGLWDMYRKHLIDKPTLRNTRFKEVLKFWHLEDDAITSAVNEFYLDVSPYQKSLMPGAREALDYLGQKYELHLITNGFKEIQKIKIRECDIESYFDKIIISEEVGFQKPHPRIFEHSLEITGSNTGDVIYIGDHLESDIKGSQDAGWDQVFFNPDGKKHEYSPTHEIEHLDELRDLF